MITIYQLKPAFQNLLRPITIFLARKKISANSVTLFSCLASIAVGLSFFINPNQKTIFLVLPFFLFIRMALNAIDGMLAREHNMKTSLGAFLNELTDVISDGFLYFPFLLTLGVHQTLVIIFILFSALTELAGVVAGQIHGNRRYDGPLGKSDRAFVLGTLSLFTFYFPEILSKSNLDGLFVIINSITFFTVINRVQKSLKEDQK